MELGLAPSSAALGALRDPHTASHTPVIAEPVQTNRLSTSLSQGPGDLLLAPTPPALPSNGRNTSQHTRAKTEINTSSFNQHPNRVPGVLFDTLTANLRQRSYSASSSSPLRNISRNRDPPPSNRNPKNHCTPTGQSSHRKERSNASDKLRYKESTPPSPSPATLLDPDIRRPFSPSSIESVPELLHHACHNIRAVMLHLQKFGLPQSQDDEEIIDTLTDTAITSIRDLLYVSGHGPSFRHLGGGGVGTTIHASQTCLIPAQRRTIATLSKFVLSVRVVLNHSPWDVGESITHLSSDAEELERAVVDFVSIGRSVWEESHGDKAQRRLHGHFTTSHTALGQAGAGAAGTWKGFGWISLDGNEEAPRRSLDRVTFHEFVDHVLRVREELEHFLGTLKACHPGTSITEDNICSLMIHCNSRGCYRVRESCCR